VQLLWDEEKNKKLVAERGLSLETFAALILEKKYTAILKNQSREGQKIFIVPYNGYTYVVPFLIDNQQNIILKAVYPSRKYHKRFGGKNHAGNT
jgi:uncharacterized DUF497 family protein